MFFTAFCYARNSRVESIFEERWASLLQKYPDASSYLQRQLYPCREAWVLCFTHRAFNAGVQSTQRVESYNSIIKNNVNGSTSLLELERTIERLLASVPIESSQIEFESILKYYLYNGVYPINCLKYIIYIMRVYASLMRVKIRNTSYCYVIYFSIIYAKSCTSIFLCYN